MEKKLVTHCFTGKSVEDAVAQANGLNMDGCKFEDSHVLLHSNGITFVVVLEDFRSPAKEAP